MSGDQALAASELRAAAANGSARATEAGMWPRCAGDNPLPCFLMFASYDIPRSDASNMRCYPVVRKPAEQVRRAARRAIC